MVSPGSSKKRNTTAERIQASNVSERLGIRLRRATFALRRLLMARIAPLGFTHEQYAVLLCLGEQHAVTQSELSQRSFTNPNTVTDIINRLEADGLVLRVAHERDGRAYRVEITAKGHQIRRRLMGFADEITELVLGDLPVADVQTAMRCLDHVAEVSENAMRGAT